jgi:hypothetical protein
MVTTLDATMEEPVTELIVRVEPISDENPNTLVEIVDAVSDDTTTVLTKMVLTDILDALSDEKIPLFVVTVDA